MEMFLGLVFAFVGMNTFFYAVLFPYFALPNLVFSERVFREVSQRARYRRWRFGAFLFLVVALAFYSTIDYFEAHNIFWVWFVVLGTLSLLPALVFCVLKASGSKREKK